MSNFKRQQTKHVNMQAMRTRPRGGVRFDDIANQGSDLRRRAIPRLAEATAAAVNPIRPRGKCGAICTDIPPICERQLDTRANLAVSAPSISIDLTLRRAGW